MNTNTLSKRILCYGDSNTWGWVPSSMGSQRYDSSQRWPCLLQKTLGESFEIIEEGLGARTTMYDDPRPEYPGRNGLATLPVILETHLPLDLAIVMLGATDTKEMMNVSTDQSTEGMRKIIHLIKNYRTLKDTTAPKILIAVPTIVDETAGFASKLFKGGTHKGKELVTKYEKLCIEEGVYYLDPTSEVLVDKTEGVHFDASNHRKMAELMHSKIKAIFGV